MKSQNSERVKDMGRGREIYAEIKAIPPLVVRADGRNFKRVLSDKFEKPYDERFAKGMAEAVKNFFVSSGFDPKLAYIFSDEITFFLSMSLLMVG